MLIAPAPNRRILLLLNDFSKNGTLCTLASEENSHSGLQASGQKTPSGRGSAFRKESQIASTCPAVPVALKARSLFSWILFNHSRGSYLKRTIPLRWLKAFSRQARSRGFISFSTTQKVHFHLPVTWKQNLPEGKLNY